MNLRALLLLLLLLTLPAQAHHTKEHVLGAPPVAEVAPTPQATPSNTNFWLALGPFFVLVGVGVVRWGYRHRRERATKNTRAGL